MDTDYDGVEVILLDVKKGDSILLRNWEGREATRILVDGGKRENTENLEKFIEDREIDEIDHLVCSHHHHDHSSGLVKVVEEELFDIRKAWMHLPESHSDTSRIRKAVSSWNDSHEPLGEDKHKFSRRIEASLDDARNLRDALEARGIPIEEPFEGKAVGFLECLGPSESYYQSKIQTYESEDGIDANRKNFQRELVDVKQASLSTRAHNTDEWPDEPSTSDLNNTSTIFEVKPSEASMLLTADVGVEALERANHPLSDLDFVQIPHHGSRHNITPEWIDRFDADSAHVSAPNDESHPAQCVVRRFQRAHEDTDDDDQNGDDYPSVLSTHQDRKWMRFKRGDVPEEKWSEAQELPHGWSK